MKENSLTIVKPKQKVPWILMACLIIGQILATAINVAYVHPERQCLEKSQNATSLTQIP